MNDTFSRRAYCLARVTWLCWLTILIAFFVKPLFWLDLPHITDWVNAGPCGAGGCYGTETAPWLLPYEHSQLLWSLLEYPFWAPLLLAAVLPAALHARRLRALRSPFVQVGRFSEARLYRSPPAPSWRLDGKAARKHLHWYLVRLLATTLLLSLPLLILFEARFVRNYGCLHYYWLFSIPEYYVHAAMVALVMLLCAPTHRRLFGRPDPAANDERQLPVWGPHTAA